MRSALRVLLHAVVFAALVAGAFYVMFVTVEDDTWYPAPTGEEMHDDSGYVVAVINVMFYVMPMLLMAYLSALIVSRIGQSATHSKPLQHGADPIHAPN